MRPETPEAAGNGFSIAAIACGVIAAIILPIIFGPIGIILGAVAKSRNERLSTTGLVVAIAGTVVGFALGALFLALRD